MVNGITILFRVYSELSISYFGFDIGDDLEH